MASGQMIMVLAAFALLSLLVLGVNRTIIEKTEVILDTEASITSISIAQAMIDEILRKEYDERAIGVRIYNTADMTPVNLLGLDASETVALPDTFPFLSATVYDDIDDYNGYRRVVTTPLLGDFFIEDSIYYVSESNFSQKSTTPTFYKRVVVKVTHSLMKVPVVLTDITVYRRYI